MLTSRFRELVLLEIAEPSLEIHTIHNFYAHGREPNRHLMLQGSLSPYQRITEGARVSMVFESREGVMAYLFRTAHDVLAFGVF